MDAPILTTKLTIPPLSNTVITRTRLIEALNRNAGLKVTMLCAPAGSGKTTLIASWLQTLKKNGQTRIAWYSIEEDDNDPIRFLSYFVAALDNITPGIRQTIAPLLPMFPVSNIKQLMSMLINELAQSTHGCILVLDDFHSITNRDLLPAIGYFIDHLPFHCRLILSSREEPSLPLHRWRARGESTEINVQDLRFEGEETEEFLRRTMGLELSPRDIRSLELRTEGWAAGLQMAALSLRSELGATDPAILLEKIEAFSGGHRYVIDYMATEVIRRQSPEVCLFLYKTSILDCFNASLCNAVTELTNSQSLLLRLEKANLFLFSLDANRHWYRYHHLFADVLRAELTAEEQARLHLLASGWFEGTGMVTEAIKHAVQGGDTMRAVELIRKKLTDLIRVGDVATIHRWLDSLPVEVVRKHWDMLAMKGWMHYLRGEIRAAESIAELSKQESLEGESQHHRGIVLGFRAFVYVVHGEPGLALKFAAEAFDLLDSGSPFLPVAKCVEGVAHEHLGNYRAAAVALNEAIELGGKCGNQVTSLGAMGYMLKLFRLQGKLSEAISRCEAILNLFSDSRGNLMPIAFSVAVSLGEAYYERNDLIGARKYLSAGLGLSQQIGLPFSTLDAQFALIKLHFAQGETQEAEDLLRDSYHLAKEYGDPRYLRMHKCLKTELLVRMNRLDEAVETLGNLSVASIEGREPELRLQARILLAQNRPGPAITLLHRLEENAREHDRIRSLIIIHLRQAMACQVLQRTADAQRYLDKALLLAAEEGYRRLFLDEGPTLGSLLATRSSEESSFVAGLQAAGATATNRDNPTALAQTQIDLLSSTQVEILRLVAQGCSNRDIASKLGITEGTTKWHLNQIYGKLNVHSRTQAILQAQQLRLL